MSNAVKLTRSAPGPNGSIQNRSYDQLFLGRRNSTPGNIVWPSRPVFVIAAVWRQSQSPRRSRRQVALHRIETDGSESVIQRERIERGDFTSSRPCTIGASGFLGPVHTPCPRWKIGNPRNEVGRPFLGGLFCP